jgi:membrane fusion protein (multidrug efflux system)
MNIPRTHALVIPQQSTYELQDRRYVFVVDAHSVVHARQIEVADEQPGIFVVAKGLSPRDRILVDGVQKVNDGERIQFKIQNSKLKLRSF